MKINSFKIIEYLYYLSLISLIIIYLFPGSLIGYLIYGDLGRQPKLIDSLIGTSINHFFYFIFLTIIVLILNTRHSKTLTNVYFIFLLAIVLELGHLIVPNRSFEFYDLLANITGVLIPIFVKKVVK
tara:strand:+ start:574 stop:954 length:381 start_codon:yes stop_codon:yes gene_type:complete